MGQCKWCGRSGIFLGLSKNGLCSNCDPLIMADLETRVRHINESVEIMLKTKNIDVLVSRYDFIIKTAEHLYQYEQRNIVTTNQPPSFYLNGRIANRDDAITECFERIFNDLKINLLGIKTEKGRNSQILSFKEQLSKYRVTMSRKSLLDQIEEEVKRLLPEENNTDYDVIEGEFSVVTDEPQTTERVSSKEIVVHNEENVRTGEHKAQYVIFSNKDPESIVSTISYQVQFNIYTNKPEMVVLPMDDPSTVFRKLEVRRPLNIDAVPKLPYYPSYAKMEPEQRWIYLTWLEDICQKIDIGYVFIYYYGLERQLLSSYSDNILIEVNLLKRFHDNKSFDAYSTSALLYSTIFHNDLEKLKMIYENPVFDKLSDDELLINYFLGYDLTIKTLIQLAKSIKTINLRYYKSVPIAFENVLGEQLYVRYQKDSFPFASKYNLSEIPKRNRVIFANISFPQNIRSLDIPDFLSHEPFMAEIHSLFSNVHTIMKSQFSRKVKSNSKEI